MFNSRAWHVFKAFATVLAWLGAFITLLGTEPGLALIPKALQGFHGLPHFYPYPVMQFGAFIMLAVSGAGTLMVLIGGLLSRPRYLWQVVVCIGVVYLIAAVTQAAYLQYYYENSDLLRYVLLSPPGLVCIGSGIAIWRLRKRNRIVGEIPSQPDSVSNAE